MTHIKKLIKFSFLVCLIAVVYYQGRAVQWSDLNVLQIKSEFLVASFLGAAVVALASLYVPFMILRNVGISVPRGRYFHAISKAALTKYFWPNPMLMVLPQSYLLKKEGVAYNWSVFIYFFDNAMATGTIMAISASFLLSTLWTVAGPLRLAVALLFQVGFTLLFWLLRSPIVKLINFVLGALNRRFKFWDFAPEISAPVFFWAHLSYFGIFIVSGSAHISLAYGIFSSASFWNSALSFNVVFALTMGTSLSRLLPILPGGLGIRDGAQGWLLQGLIPSALLFVYVAACRLLVMVSELFVGLLLYLVTLNRRQETA